MHSTLIRCSNLSLNLNVLTTVSLAFLFLVITGVGPIFWSMIIVVIIVCEEIFDRCCRYSALVVRR